MSSFLRRQCRLIAISVAVSVGLAAWLAAREAPEYRASGVIRITGVEAPVGADVDPLLSEMVVLTGRTVLGRAVDREGLRLFSPETGAPAAFVDSAVVTLPPERSATVVLEPGEEAVAYGAPANRRTAAYGEPILLTGLRFVIPARPPDGTHALLVVSRDRAIDYLADRLATTPESGTGVVRLRVASAAPAVAVRAVNAILSAYQATRAETARQALGRRGAFLVQELRAADSLLIVARGEAEILRAREEEALERSRRQADLLLYESVLARLEAMRGSGQAVDPSSLMSLPGIAEDSAVERLYAQLEGYRRDRESLLTGPEARSPGHPDVQRLNSLMASTEESLIRAARRRLTALRARSIPVPVDSGVPASAAGAGEDVLYLPRDLEALEEEANRLREEVRDIRLAEASETGGVEVVQPATRAEPAPSKVWWRLLVGLGVGLVLGVAAGAGRELLAPRPRRVPPPPRAVERTAGPERGAVEEAAAGRSVEGEGPSRAEEAVGDSAVPSLGVIPEVTPSLAEPTPDGDFRPGPTQAAGMEAYRSLRANLVSSRWGLKTLVVTSAHPGEGKTTTSTNLAATYARQGRKVVLVECDLRRPSLGRYFGISKEVDLMDVLFHDHDWREAIQLTRMPGLYVILGEKTFPRAGESLGGAEMKRLLAELAAEYDLVILDTSPLLVASDAVALGPIVDGVVIVVRATRTDRATVEGIVRRLRDAGANVLGTILNDPEGAGSPG